MTLLETGNLVGGRFRLQQRIGDGGHAEIWAAWDEQQQVRVALKFLHPHLCSASEARLVLRHEAHMARCLDHPGVLRTGEPQQDGEDYFLPMEYAAGGDLKRLRGAPYMETVPVLLRVAALLGHAHERGIVHRDIKPGNLLFDAQGTLRLADFGASARTGSARTLAVGSPFSASPQQLAGAPAMPADDIYGLGALAYELLGGHPPYYPDLDALRVAGQAPPALQPVQPAPARLVRLVMAMLAREPAGRPADMQAVARELRAVLEDTLPAIPATAMIDEGTAPAADAMPPAGRTGRWRMLAWVLMVAVAVAVVVLASLHDWGNAGTGAAPPAPLASPGSSDPQAPVAEEQAPADPVQEGFGREMVAARLALSAARPAQARAALEQAARLRPDVPEVAEGLAAVERLEQVLQLHSAGVREEAAGRLAEARDQFHAALAIDPGFAPAAEGRNRVAARLDEQAERAARQAAAVARAAQDARDGQSGRELEAAEQWQQAQALYRSVQERDPQALFALEGLARVSQRAALDGRLEGYLAQPARLADPAVWVEAGRTLAAAQALPAGPRLARQQQALQALLASYDAPVRVAIHSDSRTEVRITRVGGLGRFMSHELDLRPGQYTAVGTREGYRDVRVEFVVEPGQRDMVLAVACTEQI